MEQQASYITVARAADMLGVTPYAALELAEAGRLEHQLREDGRRYVSVPSLIAYAEARS